MFHARFTRIVAAYQYKKGIKFIILFKVNKICKCNLKSTLLFYVVIISVLNEITGGAIIK